MGLFDAPSASLFRTAADGRLLFRPFGRRAGTWEVSPERAAELGRWQKRYMMVAFVCIIVVVQRWQFAALWLAPPLLAPLYIKYWHFSRTLPRTDEEPVTVRRAEAFAATAAATGSRVLMFATIGSALLFAAGVWMCIVRPGRDAYLVVAFFGLCMVVNGVQLRVARRRGR